MELIPKAQLIAGMLALLVSAMTGWQLHAQMLAPVTRCAGPKIVAQPSPNMPAGSSVQDLDYSWQHWPHVTDF